MATMARNQGFLQFVKFEGLGNDFIMIDNTASPIPCLTSAHAVKLCDRNHGIGADGVIFAMPGENGCDVTMRMFNSDGSEPQMCGNGIRCLIKFLHTFVSHKNGKDDADQHHKRTNYAIWTLAGRIYAKLTEDGNVTVNMGKPILAAQQVPTLLAPNCDEKVIEAELVVNDSIYLTTAVSMGNPHSVIFVEDLELIRPTFKQLGPLFERHVAFPESVNTEFVQVHSPQHVSVLVWERGSGPTLACGTGACAVVVAGVLTGRLDHRCRVTLPGGDLLIEWEQNEHGTVQMTGPAQPVFHGNILMNL